MTTAEMATYGYDQINQARAEPNTVSKQTTYEALKTLYRITVKANGP